MVDVGSVEEFRDGGVTIVSVAGKELGIIRYGHDEVYAVLNRCPHMGGPLCEGHLGSKLEGAPGEVEADTGNLVISCPWHHWEFYVQSGRSLFDRKYRVKTYPAKVELGRVLVEIRWAGSARWDERKEAVTNEL